MRTQTKLFALTLTSLLVSAGASAQPLVSEAPYYNAGSQYTASLDRTSGQWWVQPTAGQDIEIHTGLCPTGTTIPVGLWLLVRDADGRPELLAPSTTRLPAGHADRVPMRACDEAKDNQLAVPQTLLNLLTSTTGAIYVRDGNVHE